MIPLFARGPDGVPILPDFWYLPTWQNYGFVFPEWFCFKA